MLKGKNDAPYKILESCWNDDSTLQLTYRLGFVQVPFEVDVLNRKTKMKIIQSEQSTGITLH